MKLPIIIMLVLMPLVLTAYAEAPSHVDVYDYPFNITLLEGGNFTLYNNGTNTISFSGSFPGTVEVDSQETFELPVYYFNAPNTYYLRDMSLPDTYISTVTLVNPTPVYVPPTPSFTSTSNETLGSFESISNSTFVEPTAPKVVLQELPCGVKEQGEVTTQDCSVTFNNGVAKAKVMFYNGDSTPYINYKTVGYFVNNGVQGEPITMMIDRIEPYEYKQMIFIDRSSSGVSEFELKLGENITFTQIATGGETVEETESTTESTSDTEVLNLRLEILKVIESIFRLVLQ